jgi:hypothetical protein
VARPDKIEDWMREAAENMVSTGLSLKQAAMDLGRELSSQDAELILRRKSFKRLLWEAQFRWSNAVASDPNFSRDSTIGKLLDLGRQLEEEGKHDKAADCIFKAAKIAGFVGPESTVSVFGELSAKDLEQIREAVAKDNKSAGVN